MKIYNEYVDDGFSGANFNRPAFLKMKKDIESKKINLVITKNLARFGRNYVEAGYYIEKYFPDNLVRYIAILDNIDTFIENSSNDFAGLKSVLNEKYCKDTSLAVKRSKRKKMVEGFYACNTPPFGYKKDPDNPGRLVIDGTSSKTVKKIFELKESGFTIRQIVDYLDKYNYCTPSKYMNIRGLENVKKKQLWRSSSVQKILSNQLYLGHCIRGKTQSVSYKSKARISKTRNDYIVTKNTHEALVSEETFRKVHSNNKYGVSQSKNAKEFLLKDYIYCKECGSRLLYKIGDNKRKIYLYCSKNSQNEKLCTNNCKIDYYKIEDKLFELIKLEYEKYIDDLIINKKLFEEYSDNFINNKKSEIEKIDLKITQLNTKITTLYNDRLSNKVTEDNYKERYNSLVIKRKSLVEQKCLIEGEIYKQKLNENDINYMKNLLDKIKNIHKKDIESKVIAKIVRDIKVGKNKCFINLKLSNTNSYSDYLSKPYKL